MTTIQIDPNELSDKTLVTGKTKGMDKAIAQWMRRYSQTTTGFYEDLR